MAASSPPPLFRRLAGGGPFFRGFPFRWALQFALSLVRCLTLQDATPCSREDPLYECGRPCDTLSCLFFTAPWLRQSQSILMQEVQQTNDIDLTCYKTLPTKPVTCLQVVFMSLEWPVALPAENLVNPALHPPMRIPTRNILRALSHLRWRRDSLQPPQIQRGSLDRKTCVHILDGGLRCVTWNTRGLIGSVRLPHTSPGN